MSLEIKYKENYKFIQSCCHSKKNKNIGASRAYYAVFQKIKDFLINKEFDYNTFLSSIGSKD